MLFRSSQGENALAVYGEVSAAAPGASSAAVKGVNNGKGDAGIGVWGQQNGKGFGVYGSAPSGRGVFGITDTGAGVYGSAGGATGVGVYGVASGDDADAHGIVGVSKNGAGVHGSSGHTGVFAQGKSWGVYGTSDQYAIYGTSPVTGKGYAGFFLGRVSIQGTLSKPAGSFKIDHPLDPANKYLLHSFVESPDMMNIYNGNVTLDATGGAVVTMPEWFEALNRDFRYQLTAIGAPGPNLHIAQEITGGRFRIAGGSAGLKVSWQVTGVRQDAYANAHRIPTEELKPEGERGRYLYPELVGASEDLQIGRPGPQDPPAPDRARSGAPPPSASLSRNPVQ